MFEELHMLQQNKRLFFQQEEECNFNVYHVKNAVSIYLQYIIFRRAVDYKQDWFANIVCKSLTRIFGAYMLCAVLLIVKTWQQNIRKLNSYFISVLQQCKFWNP